MSRQSLQTGAYQELYCDDDVLVYARSLDQEHTLVAINLGSSVSEVTLPVWRLGLESGELSSLFDENSVLSVDDGQLQLTLQPVSSLVLVN